MTLRSRRKMPASSERQLTLEMFDPRRAPTLAGLSLVRAATPTDLLPHSRIVRKLPLLGPHFVGPIERECDQ